MKNLILVLAMILFSGCVTARELKSTPSLGKEELLSWPHYPHFHPKPHKVHRARKPSPLHPAGRHHPVPFHPPPEVTKCLSDGQDARRCLVDIFRASVTRKTAIGPDCCAAIRKMNKDCEKTVFGSFHNPLVHTYVKLHCSNKAVSSPAGAPSGAVSSPAAAPSRAVSSPAAAPSRAVSSPAAAPSPA
ncbi:unnamed protein product [Microthlaspi erraticum]|uniref:Prolamin-like domain-containing protein n=1 Tax=Microthlaspi erraticum TaxID=1685480 RepID=A0A6D2L4F0_9BRAS|nr:unnamed protein product [Microthlaspi erraticum]